MAQERMQFSDSEFDSDNSEFGSDFDDENESGNESKRRKVSGSDSIYNSESESEDESGSDSDSGSESENGSIEELTKCRTDNEGHIICRPDQKLGKYKYQSILGEGAFGRVIQANHCITGRKAAIKVIKNETGKRKSAMMEIIALTKIACRDPNEESLCIKMTKWFNYNGHICIVFPLLGASVFDFLKSNDFEPFTVDNIRHIGYQLCTAVAFLHSNGITHTDLKPENVLFVNSSYRTVYDDQQKKSVRQPICTDIRLIDFGNATRDDDIHCPVIGTVYYQSPEVILRLGWTNLCDIWAVGCTLFEMYFGNLLFPTEDDLQHLAMMEKILGPIPSTMANSTKKTQFFKEGKLNWEWNDADEDTKNFCAPLKEFLKYDTEDDNALLDIIGKMLLYEPIKRISMSETLKQPFFQKLPTHRRT